MTMALHGPYDIFLVVTCQGVTYLSDTVKGVVDRTTPKALVTSPPNHGATDSAQNISVTFDETVNCKLTYAGVSVGDLPPQPAAVACDGATVKVIPSAAQV